MYDPYLTSESLYHLCKDECKRHGVNFKYFYKKILDNETIPITKGQVLGMLDEMLVTAFWADYDNMYKDIGYPKYSQRVKTPGMVGIKYDKAG